jgi:carboxyl-terminal processing protease
MKKYQKFIISILMGIIISISFFSGYIYKSLQLINNQSEPKEIDFSLLWEAYKHIEDNFLKAEDINYQDLVYGAVSGMVNSLNDPYTVFFNPEDTKKFLEDVDGRFEGVGMEVGIRDNNFQVIAPLKGTPAEKSGIKAGDLILEIDGFLTTGFSVDELVSLIRGPKNTEVVLTVSRDGWSQPKKITIIRKVIHIPALEWEIINENISHIKLYHFHKDAEKEFNETVFKILNSPTKGIILDLRNNTGGYLEVAENIAGLFLEKDTPFVIVENYKGKQDIIRTKGTGRLLKYPTVILINEGSASASEILAGALRDEREVALVGETSYGKGLIQRLDYLSNGSSIKITVSEWLTPKGNPIAEKGLTPDYEVKIIDEEIDNQLNKAVEI